MSEDLEKDPENYSTGTTTMVSPSKLKKFCKAEIKRLRPAWQATQVAQSVVNEAEAHLRAWLRARIQHHPTKGKTLT